MKGVDRMFSKRKEAKLKRQLIRLAYEKPELRKDLLFLVKNAGAYDYERLKRLNDLEGSDPALGDALARELNRRGGGPIPVGKTMENGIIRVHRFATSIRVVDLTNAGKRGKNVSIFAFYMLDKVKAYTDLIDSFTSFLRKANYKSALEYAYKVMEEIHTSNNSSFAPKIEERSEKGVKVDPPGVDPIKISNPLMVAVVEPQDFYFRDITDKNLPAIMPRKRKRSASKIVYAWVQKNRDVVERMSLQDVMDALRNMGVDFHYWLTMD